MKKNLVVLTGAGISAESGLGTFRDSGGLWENYKIEDVATPLAWHKNQALVQDFYNQRRKNCLDAKPNLAHFKLKELESSFNVQIITQNIDDLHERAGSKNILHLHGEILKSKCSVCPESLYYNIDKNLSKEDKCPLGHQLRPHVVWFGEDVPLLDQAIDFTIDADILLIIGTSLQVYPAANLIHHANLSCSIYLIDPNDLNISNSRFTHIKKKATEGILEFMKILQQKNGN